MTGFESLLAGRTLGGRYRVDALIGRGGMGAVYRALDERLGRAVAVKVISPPAGVPASTRQELRARFQREARSAARLHHPNVVTIHDFGTDAELDLDYLVMNLLGGEDLATRMARPEPFTPGQAVAILSGAARGLAAGHRAGLVHRDVKPGNLFLCGDEDGGPVEVRVLDFGIAKAVADEATVTHLTRFGHAPLSPAYAAPEQLRGDPNPGPPCDVYGLGAIGWELLAGARPFTQEQLARIADGHHVPAPAPPPGTALDGLLGAVLLRALELSPALRPRDAAAFLDELEGAVAGRMPVPVPRPAAPPPLPAVTDARTNGRAGVVEGPTVLAPSAGTNPVDVSSGDPSKPGLVPCPDCGHPVSRHAPACPRCGMPLGRRRGRAAGVAAAFVTGGLLIGGAVFALARQGLVDRPATPAADALSSLDTVRVVEARRPVHVPAPEWRVESVDSDGSCSSLFDACIRVSCAVANTGDAAGETEFTARLVGEREYERTRGVRLDAGGREVLYFDFPDVHNGERFDQVTCRAARQDARAGPDAPSGAGGPDPGDTAAA
jgi:serine/threonine protein kinase